MTETLNYKKKPSYHSKRKISKELIIIFGRTLTIGKRKYQEKFKYAAYDLCACNSLLLDHSKDLNICISAYGEYNEVNAGVYLFGIIFTKCKYICIQVFSYFYI